MRLLEFEQGSAEWLAVRRQFRPASETPAVLGISPFQTARQLWEVRTGRREVFVNAAMREGTAREDEVRQKAAARYGEDWSPIVAIEGDYLASLDGISGCGSCVLEIKVSRKTHAAVAAGEIPRHYRAQMQHQMHVTSAGRAIMAAMDPDSGEVAYLELSADKDEQKAIREAWDAFWPLLELDNYIDPREGQHAEADWIAAANAWRQAQIAKAQADAAEKMARERLDQLAAGQMIASGAGVRLVRSVRAGTIDYKRLLVDQQIAPELAAQYRKPATITTTIREARN